MPVVFCPQCDVELDHDLEDVGYLVECPACLKQFVATADRTGDALVKPVAPPVEALVVAAVILEQPPSASKPTVETRDTIQTECRVCQGIVTIDKTDVGHRVECPLCQQVFLATAKKWKKPSRRTETEEDNDDDEDDDERNLTDRELRKKRQDEQDEFNPKRMLRNAKGDLGSVAKAVTVLGWIDIICGVLSILIGIIFLIVLLNTAPGPLAEFWVYMNICPGIGSTLLGAVKVFGGAAMKNVKSRNMALMGCWASLLPLNIGACLSFFMFPAYFVSLVFGIIGLVNMSKTGIKKAFEFNKPDGDMDAF